MMKKRIVSLLMVLMLLVPGLALADISLGMTGSEVLALQSWLSTYGDYKGALDADFDEEVRQAVSNFQARNGLAVTGSASDAMMSLMSSGNGITTRGRTLNAENSGLGNETIPSGTGSTGNTGSTGSNSLTQGMRGAEIESLQALLKHYEYYTGAIDGIFGGGVLAAVKNFQSRNGLTVDGKVGPKTMAVLTSGNAVGKNDNRDALATGASGEQVKELQRKLRETYYYAGTIDGVFDSDITRAVKAFQASAGLKVDGKVGKQTKEALFNKTARIFNGGLPVRTLGSGDRGYDVYVLQQKLASLNYLNISPSGYFGTDTVAAVKAFQAANGLKTDGKAGNILRRYLWPSTVDSQEEIENQKQGTVDDPFIDRSLRLGSYGSDVANAQMRLKSARYLLGNADGIFGPKTKAAVEALQKDYGLKVDGVIGSQTWAVIKTFNVANAEQGVVDPEKPSVGANVRKIQKGDSGATVKKLQQQLITLGYMYAGDDDGKFGVKTEKAVKRFQQDHRLTVDGVVGTQTFVCLNEALGVQWEVSVG